MNSNILGKRIKILRTEAGLTQEEFGKPYNLKKSTVSQYESGSSKPDDELKKRIANDYNVSLDWLMGLSEIRNPYSELKINIPEEYTDKYKVTSRDKKQYEEEMKKANEAFFLNDELSEDAKKEMLDLMSELFWKAKALNKRKPKDK